MVYRLGLKTSRFAIIVGLTLAIAVPKSDIPLTPPLLYVPLILLAVGIALWLGCVDR